jgi:hypothetical protein
VPEPHAFFVRKLRRSSRGVSRPSQPASRFVTTRNAPRIEAGWPQHRHDFRFSKTKIFLRQRLDSQTSIESAGEFRVFAQQFPRWFGASRAAPIRKSRN